ncbi:hypothetical protein [Teredinibacter sp. KSP-S5-2]|uniref:hypothetical protein n=1 Tax=Teredinibacter sp. KSP-S5-2 TaxID=3034506 RepID=UPI0029349C3C|nr:hypothetical protein [Teredinibacter sp. KSP-S5-2]WNO10974.1 hypothetical protein P5V12_07265 [Teredinibacter sp. KSP-S5-2]
MKIKVLSIVCFVQLLVIVFGCIYVFLLRKSVDNYQLTTLKDKVLVDVLLIQRYYLDPEEFEKEYKCEIFRGYDEYKLQLNIMNVDNEHKGYIEHSFNKYGVSCDQ